jgi:hypothetical protein
MRETDALCKARPFEIVGWRQKTHGSIPETPPGLYFTIALWVVPAGGGAQGAGGGSNSKLW